MEQMIQMELFDEPVTPGCPNCTVKHLSAALSYLVDTDWPTTLPLISPTRKLVLLARALINLNEAAAGYMSHYGIAIGLLERAELAAMVKRHSQPAEDFISKVRSIRIRLASDTFCAGAVSDLVEMLQGSHMAMVFAHLAEAQRESPGRINYASLYVDNPPEVVAKNLVDDINRLRDEYFKFNELEEKGGEEQMATAKKAKAPAAKACKGAKAAKACKGAKAAKACDKGGKSKK